MHNLARWDGTAWHASGNFNGIIYALFVRGGELYAAGTFTLADAASANHIARFDGEQWNGIGDGSRGLATGSTGNVYVLTPDDSGLWVGGRFSHIGTIPASNISHWNFCTPGPVLPNHDSLFVNGTEVTVGWHMPQTTAKHLSPAAVSFHVQVGVGAAFQDIAADLDNITDTFVTISALEQNTLYSWRVQAIVNDTIGAWSERSTFTTGMATDVNDPSQDLPARFSLRQNYPNPFNPSTTISFTLPGKSTVHLNVYNIAGQKVATLADGSMDAGEHTVVWDGSVESGGKAASGVYLYRLDAGRYSSTKKMLLLK